MTKQFTFVQGRELLEREGLTEIIAPWEDGLRDATGRGTFEWWYFDAHFDDGSTAVVVYLTKPLLHRTDRLSPTVQIFITRPDGRMLRNFPPPVIYPADQFVAGTDQCNVRIGPNWVRGDLGRYELHAEGAGLEADLVFTGDVPAWRPGGGKIYYDERRTEYMGWLPSIPFGQVAGTLTYDGQRRHVTGTGYHDHNWGNIDLNKVMSHWYWARAHVGDYSLIAAEITHAKAYGARKLPFFMLAHRQRILTGEGGPLTLRLGAEVAHASGKRYPTQLDFEWLLDSSSARVSFRNPEVIEATSLLIYLPSWKRALARLIVDPYYFRFNADLELTVDMAGHQETQRGRGLYELMLLG